MKQKTSHFDRSSGIVAAMEYTRMTRSDAARRPLIPVIGNCQFPTINLQVIRRLFK